MHNPYNMLLNHRDICLQFRRQQRSPTRYCGTRLQLRTPKLMHCKTWTCRLATSAPCATHSYCVKPEKFWVLFVLSPGDFGVRPSLRPSALLSKLTWGHLIPRRELSSFLQSRLSRQWNTKLIIPKLYSIHHQASRGMSVNAICRMKV